MCFERHEFDLERVKRRMLIREKDLVTMILLRELSPLSKMNGSLSQGGGWGEVDSDVANVFKVDALQR